MKIRFWIGLSLSLILFFSSCYNKKRPADTVRIGVATGPELILAQTAKKVALQRYGLKVDLVPFTDYILPNVALSQGDLDANVYQHKPFLDKQSEQRGYKFAILGKTFVFPIAAYSHKIKDISQLKEGDKIAIPNDPTNEGRALLLFQKYKLIELKKGVGILPKLTDITANYKQLKFIELEAPQMTRVLDDPQIVVSVINNNFASQINLNPIKDGLMIEDGNSPYVNLVVAQIKDKNNPKLQQFTQAYESEEVAAVADSIFKGGAIKGW
ncbi:MAG: methionine ABC transporter substrate-binding protein MetQ [Pseudopedobacter saltans]|uniref:Lipoprotein n=1 Tax=Pseudopedobacter saltans TaxID=151895 RepID=A0A2W5EN99_9SPHI|nr:MAG: methionine ABC transporter substrate-binding protein MetQ [Pseudopedobacter saltans]